MLLPLEEYGVGEVDKGVGDRDRWGCISGADTPTVVAKARS